MKTRLCACFFVVALAALLASCDGGVGEEPPAREGFDRATMLGHVSDALILPAYGALKEAVDALDAATVAFAEAPSASNLDGVQGRLKDVRLAWQEANLFQFGPAESVALRASLNTYPVDEDRVEANVASGSYTLGAVSNRAAAGFPALDYLVHGIGVTEADVLAAYTDAADAPSRLAYIQDNVALIKEAVDATVNAWAESGDDYAGTFLSERNAGTDVGSSLGMLINAFVLHYERFIRDGKIGIPAGVRSAGVPRPQLTEAHYGGYSAELALANLQAAKRLFLGNAAAGADGSGLDDHLQALGAEALAAQVVTEFDEAIAALEALGDPLSEQITSNNEPVLAVFQEMQDVIVLLKADMTSVLGVTITYQDNDGD